MDDEMIATASSLTSLVRAVRDDKAPEYGPDQARLDQEASLAMAESSRRGGEPVQLPLALGLAQGVPAKGAYPCRCADSAALTLKFQSSCSVHRRLAAQTGETASVLMSTKYR